MKVYVLERSVDYEGSQICGVCESEIKALMWCADEVTKIRTADKKYKILELPFGFKIVDICFSYEIWEVT